MVLFIRLKFFQHVNEAWVWEESTAVRSAGAALWCYSCYLRTAACAGMSCFSQLAPQGFSPRLGGWWLMLICCERKVLLAGWWLLTDVELV
jgi:hypothetical protein